MCTRHVKELSMPSLRLSLCLIFALMCTAVLPLSRPQPAGAQELPKGIPVGAEKATVSGYDDGDKFRVKIEGKTETVLLISADAPEKNECFADKSARQLKKYIPEGSTVYLERDKDDRDGKDRLLRYAWTAKDNGKATFVDERMIANGFSTFKSREDNSKYDTRLEKDQSKAKKAKRGLWKDCGGGHVENTTVPEATKVPKLGEKNLPAPIGSTLETDGQAVTIQSAFYSYDYGYSQPKGGYIYLVVTVRIENIEKSGGDSHGYDEGRFAGKDVETGASYDSVFTLADQPLGSGDLSPGEFVVGTIVLEVQDVSRPVLVEYDPSRLGGGEVYWIAVR
jgi:micrococcal nuclease